MSAGVNDLKSQDNEIHAGFIPLTDCAPLVMVRELGLDRAEGFTLHLHREVSWANIRDKVDVGLFDCAHMLAPLPLAAKLGIGRATAEVIAPVALSLNGNTITVSARLFEDMTEADPASASHSGMAAARAVAAVVKQRAAQGLPPLTFGIVFPFSCHNYDLRAWLASAGIDPDNDVNLVVIPPPLIADSLKAGRVDGFCAGEPWGSVAAGDGSGVIVATKAQLWRNSPEKVLGVRSAWAGHNPDVLDALIRAIVRAGQWLDVPGNRIGAAKVLSEARYVGVSRHQLEKALTGGLEMGAAPDLVAGDSIVFHRHGATIPRQAHAIWILTQMIRWGQAREPFDIAAIASQVYRTDIYARALAAIGAGLDVAADQPATEGVLALFGSEIFDPSAPLDYLDRCAIRAPALDLSRFKGPRV